MRARDSILEALNQARLALQSDWTQPSLPTERRPKRHQLQAVQALRAMGCRALLADDMGLGKTSSALWSAHAVHVHRILVVCPVSVKFNWQHEIMATLGSTWLTTVIDGTSRKRADQFVEAHSASVGGKAAIIINYDLLLHLNDEQHAFLGDFLHDSMLICDESHYLKSRDSKRSKHVEDLSLRARYVLALTGTPIRNLADDLFQQIQVIRPGTWSSFHDFTKRHLVVQSVKFGKREVRKIVGTRNLDELNAVVNTMQIKRAKSEVLDLPPKIYTYPELELDGELLRVYKAMKDFAKIELGKLIHRYTGAAQAGEGDDDYITDTKITIFDPRAKSAVEAAMRCEQIAQGFIGGIPDPLMQQLGPALRIAERIQGRPNELVFPSAPKLVWLLEAIESIVAQGGAPIVYSRFNAPMIWLKESLNRMGILAEVLHGGLDAEWRDGILRRFRDQRSHVLIVQVKIAEGWNATRCQDVLFLGRDWSPAINAQAEDRTHRMGQKGTVNVQIPIVRKTIEVMIDRRLRDKSADAEQALRNVTVAELMEAL